MRRLRPHAIEPGTSGQFLRVVSGKAAWATVAALFETLFDAKGDLLVASAADTAARLPVGTNGQVLTADSAEALGMKWASGGSGGGEGAALAVASYNPGSMSTYTTTSTAAVDVDATNLAVTFTAPTDGKVLIRLTALAKMGNADQTWCLRNGSSVVTGTEVKVLNTAGVTGADSAEFRHSAAVLITGLAANTSYTFKWGFKTSSGAVTASMFAGGAAGQAVMEVWGTAFPGYTAYTPVLTASTTNPTLGTGSVASGRYIRRGKEVSGHATIIFGTSGVAAGSGTYFISLPVAQRTADAGSPPLRRSLGTAELFDSSASTPAAAMTITPASNPNVAAIRVFSGVNPVGDNVPWTWAASDRIQITFKYETD